MKKYSLKYHSAFLHCLAYFLLGLIRWVSVEEREFRIKLHSLEIFATFEIDRFDVEKIGKYVF